MSASQNSVNANDVPNSSTPPQHQEQQTQTSEQNAAPLRQDSLTINQSPSNSEARREASPTRPRTKSEASSYVGSHRPSDPQTYGRIASDSQYGLEQVAEHEAAHVEAPPAYTELPGQLSGGNSGLGTDAIVTDDGRVNIRIDQKNRTLSQLILPQIQRQITQSQQDPAPPPPYVPEFLGGAPGQDPPPPLNVVVQVVGSRGDVQPFVALSKVLKDTYGHRVRLATHPTFKDFVVENGLEFFSIGGDPAELMAFMVKNPGLMPGFDTLRSGDIGKRRKGIAEILKGTWRSCIETGNGLGVDPLQQTVEDWMGIEDQLPEQLRKQFVADAIIANPPSFGHIHCAEKLGIPLHVMFTMPWSPTQQFPHPLANIQSSNADATITNYMSYIMVDMLTWQGLGDVINRFRKDTLHLDSISTIWAPAMLARLKVPFTYCWSPALIPKPGDWSHHISVAGFYFLNLASNYTPDAELAAFLDAEEPPIYIGFGSIVVDEPNAMTEMIFDAIRLTGKRALVSKGWGGLGGDELGKPEGVFMLGNCPHDWLFKKVSAVVHHGGAGTTAAGIAAGRPTVVVPFFGDQAFWGSMVSRAGAGPDPIPYKDLNAEKLAVAIIEALKPESLAKAQELSDKIKGEDGCQKGAQSFHQMLHYNDMRCAVVPDQPAVWRIKRTQTKLSAIAATILAQQGEVNFSDLKLFRPREYVPDEGPLEPLSGGASAVMGTVTSMMMGVADMPIQTLKLLQIHPDSRSKKGKERAESTGTDSVTEFSQIERPQTARTGTNMTNASIAGDVNGESSTHLQTCPGTLNELKDSNILVATSDVSGASDNRAALITQAVDENTGSRSPSEGRSGTLTLTASETTTLDGRQRNGSVLSADRRAKSGSAVTSPTMAENLETAVDTGKGLARIIGAGFKSPMDFSLNVAKGFHNVPKLYGAEVRQVDRVTDLESGLRTAAKEFGLGLYDGIAGIVTDPYKGAKKEGGIGFVKGVGRGLMSVPFRVMGGAFSVPGYAMKGLYQEMIKSKGKGVQNYIIAARIAQGYEAASNISQHKRDDIISRWSCMKVNIKRKRAPGAEQIDSLHSLVEEKRKRKHERWDKINAHPRKAEGQPSYLMDQSRSSSHLELLQTPGSDNENSTIEPEIRSTIPSWRQQESDRVTALRRQYGGSASSIATSTTSQGSTTSLEAQIIAEEEAERVELERTITASIAESCRDDPEDDRLIASAIRASIAELERAPLGTTQEDEEEILKRAIQASIEEAGRTECTGNEQKILEETLRKSLLETRKKQEHSINSDWDTDDTEDNEEYQRIIAESKALARYHEIHPQEYENAQSVAKDGSEVVDAISQAISGNAAPELPPKYTEAESEHHSQSQSQPESTQHDEDEELRKAIEESARVEKDRMAQLEKQKTEEHIVMEYVRKQSLLEEKHRQRMQQERDTTGAAST